MDNEKNWYPKYPSIHVCKENWYPCIQVSMYPWIQDIQVSAYPSIQKKSVSKISKYPDIRKKWYPSIPNDNITLKCCFFEKKIFSKAFSKTRYTYMYKYRFARENTKARQNTGQIHRKQDRRYSDPKARNG